MGAHRHPGPCPYDEERERIRKATGRPARICRWCGSALPAGRRKWCSDACVEERLIQTSPQHARQRLWERDAAVCSLCGRDCAAMRRRVNRMRRLVRMRPQVAWPRIYDARWLAICERMRARGWHTLFESLWEADHIVPLIEGGGHGLDNLRTLCQPCHKAETRELARRRARARRA